MICNIPVKQACKILTQHYLHIHTQHTTIKFNMLMNILIHRYLIILFLEARIAGMLKIISKSTSRSKYLFEIYIIITTLRRAVKREGATAHTLSKQHASHKYLYLALPPSSAEGEAKWAGTYHMVRLVTHPTHHLIARLPAHLHTHWRGRVYRNGGWRREGQTHRDYWTCTMLLRRILENFLL